MATDRPNLGRVRQLVDAMRDRTVLVAGDLMVDVYLQGRVERISPEGPVPVVQVRERELRLGGAANVAWNLASLGARPRLLALRGADAAGDELAALLAARGIGDGDLVTDPGRPTTVKTRVLGAGQQICRYDVEDRSPAIRLQRACIRRRGRVKPRAPYKSASRSRSDRSFPRNAGRESLANSSASPAAFLLQSKLRTADSRAARLSSASLATLSR